MTEDSEQPVRAHAPTVILVDHASVVGSPLRDALTGSGFNVLDAATGVETVRICLNYAGEIHAFVTDMALPDMWGDVLVQILSLLRPEMRPVFISGYSHESLIERQSLSGSEIFIPKPFNPEVLVRALEALLAEDAKS